MVSITVSIPNDVREMMKEFPEVNWSGFVKGCITEKARQLNEKRKMLSKLSSEKGFSDWAVRVIREGRK